MTRTQFQKILFLVIFWVLCDLFYIFFEGTMVGYNSRVYWATGEPYNFGMSLFTSLGITLVGGFILATFEVLYFDTLMRRKSFGITLMFKTVFYICSIFFFVSLTILLLTILQLQLPVSSPEVWAGFKNYLTSPVLPLHLMYWSLSVIMGLFILYINDKLGRGVLLNLLSGKYHRPQEAVKIFMFLDITSSTTIAEKIGAKKYSALLKEFFFDVDELISKTEGAVFQFVGDEVVVIWDVVNGIRDFNCLRLFFLAREKIRSLGAHYEQTYGVLPDFKAGLHYGTVIMTEVGGSKQEIAYHGEAINTTARIRSMCNEIHQKLLVSKDLLDIMPEAERQFTMESAGTFKLKGKKHDVCLYGVEQNN